MQHWLKYFKNNVFITWKPVLQYKLITWFSYCGNIDFKCIAPFQHSVGFHTETSHLICSANQMIGFYMKCNTELKWVNVITAIILGT